VTIAHYLGLTAKWVDRPLLVHDPCAPPHAAAAITSVLITRGESGAPAVSSHPRASPASSRALWTDAAADFVPDPMLRYMKIYGLTHEQLAMVSVVQREWAGKNPRATLIRRRSPPRMCCTRG
jgi:acetyl-CoA acetyltransferase